MNPQHEIDETTGEKARWDKLGIVWVNKKSMRLEVTESVTIGPDDQLVILPPRAFNGAAKAQQPADEATA